MLHKGLRPAVAGALVIATTALVAACGSSSSSSSASHSSSSVTSTKAASAPANGPLHGKTLVLSECCEDPSFASAWVPGIVASAQGRHGDDEL